MPFSFCILFILETPVSFLSFQEITSSQTQPYDFDRLPTTTVHNPDYKAVHMTQNAPESFAAKN